MDPPEGRNYLLVVASSGRPGAALRAEVNAIVTSMTFFVEWRSSESVRSADVRIAEAGP